MIRFCNSKMETASLFQLYKSPFYNVVVLPDILAFSFFLVTFRAKTGISSLLVLIPRLYITDSKALFPPSSSVQFSSEGYTVFHC